MSDTYGNNDTDEASETPDQEAAEERTENPSYNGGYNFPMMGYGIITVPPVKKVHHGKHVHNKK